ncbi:MAG: ATP-binding protein [Elusimicrobia bacterium]|nr:ATP-binding protein [Elusimicrobiota bacterium]
MRRNSLVWKLILPVITASILGILLTGFLAHNIARREILKGVDREINLSAQEIASQLASFFIQRSTDLDFVAEVPLIQDYFNNSDFGLKEEADSYLAGLEKFFSVFIHRTGVHLAAGLLDGRGVELCRVVKNKSAPRGFAGPLFIARTRAVGPSGRYISGVINTAGRPPFMIYAKPVYNSAGECKGVVYLEADLTSIGEKLNKLKVGASGFSFVSDGEDKIVLGSRRPTSGSALSAVRHIPDTDLSITVLAESADFLDPLSQIRVATFGFVIFFGLSAGLFIYRRIRLSLSPIKALVTAAGHFSKGEFDHTVEAGDSAEFATLAKAFNEMALSIKQRSGELQDRIRQLCSLQKMGCSILKKLNVEEICRVCLEASVTGLGFERGLLYWIDPVAKTLNGKYSCGMSGSGLTEENFRKRIIPLDSDDILAHVARTARPVNVNAPEKEPKCNPVFFKETGSKAFCLVPVLGSEKVYGIVAVDNWHSGKPITDEQMENLSIFCNTTGLALQNAELIESIMESQARYRTTINGTADAIAGLNEDFRVTIWNRSAERMFGVKSKDMIGNSIFPLFPPEETRRLRAELVRAGLARDFPVKGRHAETGTETNLSVTWTPIEREVEGQEWSVVIRDMTAQTKLQALLIKNEKLSAVGQLISGIAHELNNPLTAVVGYAELLERAVKPPETLKTDLAYIMKNARRCHGIVNTLLNFVRQPRNHKTACRINEVIEDTLELMHYKLEKTENIILVKKLDKELPPVFIDPQQMGQVFVNLLANACDAITAKTGPREISITSSFQNGKVRVVVQDTGGGIDRRHMDRLFQPFFTTKPEGKGTGLGLVICKRITEEQGGALSLLFSGPGTGTAFCVELQPAEEISAPLCVPAPGRVTGKRVLIIDDEEDLLPVMYRIIKGDGNTAETAAPREGLAKLASGDYDLVVSDMEMGALKGRDIYEAAMKTPSPPNFVFVTGDVLNPALVEWIERNKLTCIAKPFSLDEFSGAVRKLLAVPRIKK